MRNSWAPRVVALVALSVFSLSDVAFGVPVCPASNTTSSGTQASLSSAAKNGTGVAKTVSDAATSGADFGSCPTPEIKFAVGLDGRKETAFAPVDQTAFKHGSADNIQVISNFMCLALTNSCNANQAAKTQCAQAQTAGNAATPAQSGAQADAFNSVMGIKTNFAAVQQISNTGQPVGQPASQSGKTSSSGNSAVVQTVTTSGAADFGSCPPPEIKFAVGLDGRKETAFAPVDQAAYNHGSAQFIPNISKFMCDTLLNSCKANQAAQDQCAKALAAGNAATPAQTGAQADAFNAAMGIKTDFAVVPPLDDHGAPLNVREIQVN